jgi:predicted RNA-binding protein with PIN domain
VSADERGAAETLADVPRALWGSLLRAVRRAADGMDRAEMPAVLRPYAGWKPERLADERPRLAVARALAQDPRLRESVGAALDDQAAYEDATELDVRRLVDRHGEESAVAALATRGRWQDLAVAAAAASDRLAMEQRAVADAGSDDRGNRGAADDRGRRRRLREDLAEVRSERETQRRRAEAAEQRLRQDAAERRELAERVAGLEREVGELREQLEGERRHSAARLARLRRRVEEAEARARVDDARAMRVATDLERLAANLRSAFDPTAPPHGATAALGATATIQRAPTLHPVPTPVPREIPAAESGRPCRLPAGLGEDQPAAVEALLKVDGLCVIVDGYNVTKDRLGLSAGSLEEQRRWLLRLVAGMGSRYRRRFTVVFDGTDPCPGLLPPVRDVGVVFTAGGESADERIVRFVEGLDTDAPVLVVSSDREVRDDSRALGANTTASSAFLRLAGQ